MYVFEFLREALVAVSKRKTVSALAQLLAAAQFDQIAKTRQK